MSEKIKTPTPEEAAGELLRRKEARKSLYSFTKQGWHLVEGNRPFVDNWHLAAFAEHLEAMLHGQIRDLIVNVPPRTLKSGLGSVMLTPWVWLNDPAMQFLYVSYAQDLSIRDSRRSRQIIESAWYQARWGSEYQILSDQNAKVRYDNNQSGYRLSSSVDAKVTGEGGDWIVCFPHETMVRLADGSSASIGSIVDERRDVWVLSYNHAARICEPALIEAYEENSGRPFVEVDLGDRVLRCTEDHPVWTENRGYVAAGSLEAGDRAVVGEDLP